MMPIDPEFRNKLKKKGEHKGHAIWGETDPPKKLGIHGTDVAVDQDICDGDGGCINVCPVNVFDLIDTPGHPSSDKKSDPIGESECIKCLACENECHVLAIKVNVE